MEGVTGVTNWNQVDPDHSEYPRFRRLMTQDVNAAVQGAFQSGAEEVVVADGHASASNLLIEELDARAHLNTGSPSPLSMVTGIHEDMDGVIFVGYHARAGTRRAILDHTWSSRRVMNVWLNDQLIGEIGLNAAVCGHFGAPVIMISADHAACEEAIQLLGPIEAVRVKQATGRMAAECLPPQLTREAIREAAARAVGRLAAGGAAEPPMPGPFRPETPIRLTVEFATGEMADKVELLPGVEREGGRQVKLQAGDMLTAYALFRAAVALA